MTLTAILIFIAFGLAYRLLVAARFPRARLWVLYGASLLAVYWLQPATPIRYLDYWLPTLTLALAALGWVVTAPPSGTDAPLTGRNWRQNGPAAALLVGMALLAAVLRYLLPDGPWLGPARPPQIEQALVALAFAALLAFGLGRLRLLAKALWAAIALLTILLVVLKSPPLAAAASAALRDLMQQSTALASAADLRWLGFSYIAFRLVHTLRDRQAGRLPDASLAEYMTYLVFYPAFTAGPIDRIERFLKDLRAAPTPDAASDLAAGGRRLALGLLKKFALADTLALAALGPLNAAQMSGAGWAWLLLYAYTLQIYLDFSGYTDIAIGLGKLVGITLPENFNNPYLRPNLAQFWNNWHMTLTNWFRGYYFNPLNRWLKTRKSVRLSPAVALFIPQVTTMLLIGLWHGVTWNFVLWGAWHGLGSFAQNRFSEWMLPRREAIEARPRLQRVYTVVSTLLTFHFVTLGWVWFALPDLSLSLRVFGVLAGAQ